ncbi:hypothetical protein UFOVP391_23 [uncultured Caudovirales phage]|uniref:Uncharacterized protein n=1 Tax=uncultured Caudovirales phage TaxID=2100421 RepID=A0A6J7X406_9CAUD|nr:hypothetical protein UFOVP391_23 [uncultured Caudovirales phage]
MVRIQLENGFLDTKEGTVFPLNFAVGDIRDFTKRTGTFSKTITLVGNKNNNDLLNHYYDVNIQAGTFDINALTQCAVIQNGVPILEDALLQLLSVKKSQQTDAYEQGVEYEVLIKDTRIEFFTAITNAELTDLDFTDLNHTFDAASIIDTFDNTVTDGFKYVMPFDTDNIFNVRQFKPAIYAKTYFDRIFATAGFQYEWSDLAAARFDKLLIPYNGDENTFDTTDYLVEEQIGPIQVDTPTASFGTYDNATGWTEITDVQGSFNPTTGIFTVPFNTNAASSQGFTIQYEVDFDFILDNANGLSVTNSNNAWNARPRIMAAFGTFQGQYANVLPNQNLPVNTTLASGQTTIFSGIKTGGILVMENASGSGELNTGDTFQMKLGTYTSYTAWFNGGTLYPVDAIFKVNSLRIKILPTANVQVIGGILDINQYVPLKIKQSDFVKSIFTMYNLYVDIDTDQPNKLILKHRDEYYDSGAEVDWTYKLMKEREQDLIFLPDITSKKLTLSYKQDKDSPNDVYFQMTNEVYGQLQYTFDNEYIKGEEVKEILFSPTPVVATTFDAYVPALNGEAPKTNIRILYDGGEQTCGTWDLIEYGTSGSLGNTIYPMLGHFDNALLPTFDINFGTNDYYYYSPQTLTANNLYNLYWRRTVNQINVGKMLVAMFHLNEADIQTLKLNQKVRIDNSWWNINRVIDYDANANTATKVELISIDSEIELAPFISAPGTPTSATTTAASEDSILVTKSTTANGNLSGDDVIVKGEGNIVGQGVKGLVIGDNKILNEDGIITPQINGIATPSGGYIALLSQTGTAAPTAIVLSDTIGGVTWTRIAQGEYIGTAPNPLDVLNTFVIIGNVEHDHLATAEVLTDGTIYVRTTNTQNHQHQDGNLRYSSIEVRIYG